MGKRALILADLVNMDNPTTVFAEVKNIVALMHRDFNFGFLDRVFIDTIRLYRGNYSGYRACTTQYHDLRHTTDVVLALARLIHGAHVSGVKFNARDTELAICAALLHDCGYIQTTEDTIGTGGKYTLTHVERSINFMSRYFAERDLPREDYEKCRDVILCTGHRKSIEDIEFFSPEIEILGKMTGSADLIGQFADRLYLEKLLFLYREFQEANLGYESELDLLTKTIKFYESTKKRLAEDLGNMTRFMKVHFKIRWNFSNDLYMSSVESNLKYLAVLINEHQSDYRSRLKRGGVLKKLVTQETCDAQTEEPTQYGALSQF